MKPAHTRFTVSGNVVSSGGTLEIWSFGLNFPASNYGSEANRVGACQSVSNAYISQLSTLFPPDTVLRRVRLAEIGADGKTLTNPDGSYRQADHFTTGVGTATVEADPFPLQTALVVSLDTARAGATGKGRLFAPVPRAPLGVDRRWTDSQVATFMDAFADFLSSLNNSAAIEGSLQVVSSKGYMSPVTGIRVGAYPDTQRSRRNAVLEDYQSQPLV